ncbi:MAG: hemolysin [Haloplasmataceae bacterium]|jgi:hemolysin III|nr:hemolysin [Haloplasmataceae bacterium]
MENNKKSIQDDVKNFFIRELEKRRKQKEQAELTEFMIKELEERKKAELKPGETNDLVKKYFTLGEEIFNSIVHGVGAIFSIVALVLLILKSEETIEIVAMSIFASSSILLYTMSCLYHAFPKGRTKNVFERFDHLSIFILIAGSYTPFCFLLFDETLGWVLFGIQWGLAIIGIVFKSIWINKFVILSVVIYILMGWSIVFGFNQLINGLDLPGLILLISGGVSYTVGTIFYVFPLFKYHHGIWHFFVIFGTVLHFLCLYYYVL